MSRPNISCGTRAERMLRGLGYFGPAAGAAEALQRFAGAADITVVRLVPATR